jgi:heme-degrading monooxygenase HmoA
MIARIWRAQAASQRDADAYQVLFAEVAQRLRALPGFRGVHLLRADGARENGDQHGGAAGRDDGAEFVTVTLFESLDDVRGFAGEAYQRANVSPAARRVLAHVDEHVRHYAVVLTG